MSHAGEQDQPGLFAGTGELAALLRSVDWSKTPLGPPDRWPRSLTTALRTMLGPLEGALAHANALLSAQVRHEAARAVRESEERYRTLVSQVKDYAIFSVDATGIITSWNEGAEHVLGYARDEFIGMPASELFTPEDRAAEVDCLELERARETGAANNDRWMMAKGARRFWAMGITTALRDEGGALLGFTKVMRDQTDWKRAQEALRESESRFRQLADSMPLIVWAARPDGFIDYYNKRWYEYTGFPEGYGDESWTPILHPDDVTMCREAWYAAVRSGEPYEIEYRFHDRLTGGCRWHLGRALPIRESGDGEGKIVRWYGTCIDIQDLVEAREGAKRSSEELESLVQRRTRELEDSHERLRLSERMASIGTLSAGLGHDMGNLLLPVRIRLESMAARALPAETRGDLEAIGSCVDYLQRLTNGLRLFALDPDDATASGGPGPFGAAGTDGGTDLREWWSDVEPFLRNALPHGVALQHEPRGLEREGDAGREVPAVAVARHRLTQAVFNLVQNAGDAIARGGGRESGVVRVAAGAAKGMVQIRVEDNGPGMTPEVKRRCMEPFYTTKTRGLSTGLGLALVHGIVQKVGGTVEIESELGRGTTFTLTLPAAKPGPAGAPGAGRAGAEQGGPGQRPVATVSLKDPRLAAYVTQILRSLAYEVETGETPPEGDGRAGDVWVIEDGDMTIAKAERFVRDDPARRVLVLAGLGASPDRQGAGSDDPAHRLPGLGGGARGGQRNRETAAGTGATGESAPGRIMRIGAEGERPKHSQLRQALHELVSRVGGSDAGGAGGAGI